LRKVHLKQKEVAGWMIPPVDLILVAKKKRCGIKPESAIRLQEKFMQKLCKALGEI
jgi:hypothetical protein